MRQYPLPWKLSRQTQTVQTQALAEALAEALADSRAAEVKVSAETWTALACVQAQAQARAGAVTAASRGTGSDAGASCETGGKARVFTYGEALVDSKLVGIIYSIKPDQRYQFTHELWQLYKEDWWLIQIIIPITRLPLELLQQILLIITDKASHSPLVLMRVSKHWYTIITDQG